jgi:hypothetical protein
MNTPLISRNLRRARQHELTTRLRSLARRIDITLETVRGKAIAKQHEVTLSLICQLDRHLSEGFVSVVTADEGGTE